MVAARKKCLPELEKRVNPKRRKKKKVIWVGKTIQMAMDEEEKD